MRTLNLRRSLVLCLIAACVLLDAQQPEPSTKVNSKYAEYKIPMDDGVLLATDIYLPRKHGSHPVVLVRTPYNKSVEQWLGKAFGLFGIAVVVQDCRGKFKSEGEFYPFINERSDGLATLRWIREQPWSNGVIAGWGSSYQGITQWAISDSLDFLSLVVTGSNLYEFLYPGGVFSLQSAFLWGLQNASVSQNHLTPEEFMASFKHLPLSTADDSTLSDVPFLNDWLAHEYYDAYWESMDFRGITTSPMISLAGWYDIFLDAQIKDFQAAVTSGDTESRLIVGPWAHGSLGEPNDYGGPKKTGKPQKIFKYVRNHLKGKKNRLTSPLKDKRYNLFILERNEYVGSEEWPPSETSIIPYYLGDEGGLGLEKPAVMGFHEYLYKPGDPFPSHGGTVLGEAVGPSRQNANIQRPDQLVYKKEPQAEPLILLGPVSATLWVSSDAPCTHFFVELQDVFPDGKIINIQEGIARVEFQNNQPQRKEISIWSTGYQLNPGHSLRVVISSSWFPRYNRSLNTCDPISDASEFRSAKQKVYFGLDTPSSINLPVYSADSIEKSKKYKN